MKFFRTLAVTAAALIAGSAANAGILFSDSFQGPLSSANWASTGSSQIVAAPVGSGNALNFAENRGGFDLISQAIAGSGPGRYALTVDYFCAKANGCGGYLGVANNGGGNPGTIPGSGDGWLASDDNPSTYPTPFALASSSASAFTRNTYNFAITGAGEFRLKLEDFGGAGGSVPADAYFRNISLAAVPEPATWALMIGGIGAVGGSLRRRGQRGPGLARA